MTLEAKNITFRYPRRGSAPPLEGVNLTLRSGERLGLSAPSGRGKTTLCKVLAGWERPEKGEVLLDGAPLSRFRGFCPVQLLWQHPEEVVDPLLPLRRTLEEAAGWSAIPRSCPEGSSNGSASPGRCGRSCASCCATSCPPCWTLPPRRRSGNFCWTRRSAGPWGC